MTVQGPGAIWTNSVILHAGYGGTGGLHILDGGEVFSAAAHIGEVTDSSGTVRVEGEGSTWTNSGTLRVGRAGKGKLTISGGGTVSNNNSYIGEGPSSNGTVTVEGPGSAWTNRGMLFVGHDGKGELTVSDGGKVSSAGGYIGYTAYSFNSTVKVKSGAVWTNEGNLDIGKGAYSLGTLAISDGGTVSSTLGHIGHDANARGIVTVEGSGSSWTNTYLYVGLRGSGELMISDGGIVSNTFGYIGRHDHSDGTVVVTGTGSTWANADGLYVGLDDGTGELTISNGGKVTVGETLSINANSTVTLDGGALHTRHLNLANGDFRFLGGTLVANGTITGDLALPELGSLGGNATITGDLLVSGTLAPGNSTGTLTVEGNLTLENEAWITLELASPSDYDSIVVNGALAFGGTLMLEFLDGFAPEADAEFNLFTGGYTSSSGAFADILFSASGYEGLFDYETGSLTITVIPEPSTYALLILASAALIAMRRRRCQTA